LQGKNAINPKINSNVIAEQTCRWTDVQVNRRTGIGVGRGVVGGSGHAEVLAGSDLGGVVLRERFFKGAF